MADLIPNKLSLLKKLGRLICEKCFAGKHLKKEKKDDV